MKIGKNFEIEVREIIILILFIGSLFAHVPSHSISKEIGIKEGVSITEDICAETINALSTDTKPDEIYKFANHLNESASIMKKTLDMRVDILGEKRVLGEIQ